MLLAFEETKVNFNFQIKLEDANIERSNEHEIMHLNYFLKMKSDLIDNIQG